MIEAGYYFVYPIEDEIIILKNPNKYKLARLNDSIEELILGNIIHPSLAKITKLMADNPSLTTDILTRMNGKILLPDYEEFTITEQSKENIIKDEPLFDLDKI